jgi:hypothetical protein
MARTAVKERRNAAAKRMPATVEVEAPSCAHHWIIASPEGAMSLGRCKRCGVEKEFPNSAEDGLWMRDVPQSRWTGRAEGNDFKDGF